MTLRRLLTSFIACSCFSVTALADLPPQYNTFDNAQKQAVLWDNVQLSHEALPLPKLKETHFRDIYNALKGLVNLAPTFDTFRDEMPLDRIKIIHANGSVGKVSFVPLSGHPFTGIYQTGTLGIARLSLATTPSETSYTPGMAVKFFIPQNPSLNVQVMNALSGQNSNWNYFANIFSNKIEHPTSWTLMAIEKIFSWTYAPPNDLPVAHLSKWNNEGHIVNHPLAPSRLYFKPSETITHLIDEKARDDFRVSLLAIPTGPLYEVYGEYEGDEYHIGTLMLDSQLLASDYGDKTLFFQHRRT